MTNPNRRTLRPLASAGLAGHLATLAVIAAITLGLTLLSAGSAHENVQVGTIADRVYITDGFYDPETSPQLGTYRWTQPFAQLTLPGWGPGRIHVSMTGMGTGAGEAVLSIGGVKLDRAATVPGQVWTIQAWGVSHSLNPTVTLEGPEFVAPADSRTLGRIVQRLDIYAPDARLRAWLDLGLLGLSGGLLYTCIFLWTRSSVTALIAGAALPALFGPLAIFRDPWTSTVAWTAPLAMSALLALGKLGKHTRFRMSPKLRLGATCAVIALTAALILLGMGFLNAFDADRMYQVAAGLAEYGLPTRYPGHETWTKYGFGQPLIAVPFYLLGKLGVALGGDFNLVTRFAVSLTNLPVTAFTCWLIYRGSRRFASPTISLAVAATYLLTTPALNYARTFFSEPAGGALLMSALLLILPTGVENTPASRRLLLAGACLGVMIWLKPAFAVYLPAAGLAVLYLAARHARAGRRAFDMDVWRRVLAAGALFSVGPVVAEAVQLGYNYLRYQPLPNALFYSGYEKEPGFSTPLLEGLGGLLFSPGKSLFLYAPALLLAPVGIWLMYRMGFPGRITATLILAQTAAGLVFNAVWWAWTGNFAWGPRLIMPLLPLLAWTLAPVGHFATEAARSARRMWRRSVLVAWIILAGVGALVSIPGALVDFQVYYRLHGLALAGDPGEPPTIYDPTQSPLIEEPGYLLSGLTAAVHRPTLADTGMPPIWDIIVPSTLTVTALLAAWLATRREAVIYSPIKRP